VSSNSFAASGTAQGLLERAFDVLAGEAPRHWALFCVTLGDLVIELRVGLESFQVFSSQGEVKCASAGTREPRVSAATHLAVANDLFAGNVTFLEALMTDRLSVRGEAAALSGASRAMEVFLHGLVRSPSGPVLLNLLGESAEKEG
jgi:hypothetical protein